MSRSYYKNNVRGVAATTLMSEWKQSANQALRSKVKQMLGRADYDDYVSPVTFELHIGATAGSSIMRKGNESVFEQEFASVTKTTEGYLNIYFKDPHPNYVGRPDGIEIPSPLLDDDFVIYDDYWNNAYSCNAETLNGAYAMGLADTHGSITVGKKANLIITKKLPSYYQIPYAFGSNPIAQVILNGKVFA
jgi:hypothetical protein